MLDGIVAVLKALTTLTPIGLAGLGYLIILFLKQNKRAISEVSDNHLSGLPEMAAALVRMENLLLQINNNIVYLRAKTNGGPYAGD